MARRFIYGIEASAELVEKALLPSPFEAGEIARRGVGPDETPVAVEQHDAVGLEVEDLRHQPRQEREQAASIDADDEQ